MYIALNTMKLSNYDMLVLGHLALLVFILPAHTEGFLKL